MIYRSDNIHVAMEKLAGISVRGGKHAGKSYAGAPLGMAKTKAHVPRPDRPIPGTTKLIQKAIKRKRKEKVFGAVR